MSRSLVVKCTADRDDLERTAQALTVAATAVASGVTVSLWLTGDAVLLATPGYAATLELQHASPFDELLDAVLALGTVTACTQCLARRSLTQADLLPGVQIAGAARFVEEILADDVQALVY